MVKGIIIAVVIIAILALGIFLLYRKSKQLQEQQDEQKKQMDAVAQQVSMLIIDKKRMKIKDSGLPEAVIASVPWYGKNAKQCIVKAKVGPQMMTLLCEPTIFDEVPVKKEVKATVSGLYITKIKGLHGKQATQETKKKKGLRAWALRKQKELNEQQTSSSKK